MSTLKIQLHFNKKDFVMAGPSKKMGRPTKYTQELADEICMAVSTCTLGLGKLCALHPSWPDRDTINTWRVLNRDFSAQYHEAKKIQADLYAEECMDIIDASSIEEAQLSKIRVNTRQWVASKLLPKVYGDSKAVEEDKEKQRKEEIEKMLHDAMAKAIKSKERDY
jgi:hypothetical protein